MRNILLIIFGAIDVLANIPYIIDILKGKSKPNVASWSTWALISGISMVVAFAAGEAMNTVILTAAYFIGALTVLLIGIAHGTRKYTIFDGFCQAIALLGLASWFISGNPNVALLIMLVVDIFAVIPTIRHAYQHPDEETWVTYTVAGAVALATLCMATSVSFASLAIPINYAVTNALLVSLVLYRIKKLNIAKQ